MNLPYLYLAASHEDLEQCVFIAESFEGLTNYSGYVFERDGNQYHFIQDDEGVFYFELDNMQFRSKSLADVHKIALEYFEREKPAN